LEGGIDGHFLAGSLAEGLCPLELARVALHLELFVAVLASTVLQDTACSIAVLSLDSSTYVLVTLAPTEPENSGIVADKGYALAWVGRPTAEVAGFDPVTATY
jgi:hypothetical protein